MRHVIIVRLVFLAAVACISGGGGAAAQGLQRFGTPKGKLPPLGFGPPGEEEALRERFPELAKAVNGHDRYQALWQIQKNDRNGDGIVTEAEWRESDVQAVDHFFRNDLNGDGKLTHYEHTLRWAQYRLGRDKSRIQYALDRRDGDKIPITVESTAALDDPDEDPRLTDRRRQIRNLVYYVVRIYDVNQNRRIERTEFVNHDSPYGDLTGADTNHDGELQGGELSQWLMNRLPPLPSSRLSLDFQRYDQDEDGQVSLNEYTDRSPDAMAEFSRLDRNQDGLITAEESNAESPPTEQTYTNAKSMVLPSDGIIASQLHVEDDVLIGDLDVRVQITKENDNFMALYLVGPDHQRVTLFAGGGWLPWRKAYVFENTLLDDDAAPIKTTLRDPPNPRALQPPGANSDQPSLSHWNSSSTRGTWRLIVRNENDRTGFLHSWSLIVTPAQGGPR